MLGAHSREETVAVVFGGRSSEHEISLRSAAFVLKNIPAPYRVIPVGIDRMGAWKSLEGSVLSSDLKNVEAEDLAVFLEGGKPLNMGGERAVDSIFLPAPIEALSRLPESAVRILNLESGLFFPVLHGPNGEDGRIQSLFDLAEVAYVGPDHTTSALGMDKSATRRLAEAAGLPTLRWKEVEQNAFIEQKKETLEELCGALTFPVFVKPNALGSAVGVSRAQTATELEAALENAFRYDERALVEEAANGTEVECAYMGALGAARVSQPGEIAPEDFYTYDEKYASDSPAKLFVPARLNTQQSQELRSQCLKVARALHIEGLCRIDFWWREKTGEAFFNEVNTLPGMTSISMFPKLWEHEGLTAERWIAESLQWGLTRKARRAEKSFGH